jgi:hypothetical protein
MKKLNRTQKALRAKGFAAMRTRGKIRTSSAASPWRNAFPIAEPEPIIQDHPTGKRIATTIVPTIAGEVMPVCLHRCTHINTRHGSKAERRA